MNTIDTYFKGLAELMEKVYHTQYEKIEAAAKICATALQNGKMLYLFGTGHSHMLAEEIFYRAGGLVRVYPILESALMLHERAARSSELERLPGYAQLILEDIPVNEGDVLFLFSNSGRNTVSVDMALEGNAKGMKTVCITSMNHSAAVTSRHPSGKKLYQVCDVAIDNGGCLGDAFVETKAGTVGPSSTAIGAAIMQAIVCRTTEICCENGYLPEIFHSANADGGDEANAAYLQKYKSVIKPL